MATSGDFTWPLTALVNRRQELAALEAWWAERGPRLGIVWGRRRIGKTALIEQLSHGKRTVFHTGTRRPVGDELRTLSRAAAPHLPDRDLELNPFRDWADAIDGLARAARSEPLLVVLDEFPELVAVVPELPSVLRAAWDRAVAGSQLRLLICGSAVRVMEAMREERAPLYGRFQLSLLVHPFRPHEAAEMLADLAPAERPVVYGLLGGVPLYLGWWEQRRSVRQNLLRLVCRPAAPLLTDGQLVLATEAAEGDLARQVLYAVAAGRTKHHEIADAVRADPTRVLDRLVELRLLERLAPVTEDPRQTRRRSYRIADNFLAFWLGVVAPHLAEIERGLGEGTVDVILGGLDDFLGPRFEDAFRIHLRRLAEQGALGPEVVAVGPFWTVAGDPVEIDAVVLAGRRREAAWVGEAKWARRVDAGPIVATLRRKAGALPRVRPDLRVVVAGREAVAGPVDLAVTAADIFAAEN